MQDLVGNLDCLFSLAKAHICLALDAISGTPISGNTVNSQTMII